MNEAIRTYTFLGINRRVDLHLQNLQDKNGRSCNKKLFHPILQVYGLDLPDRTSSLTLPPALIWATSMRYIKTHQ